SIVIALEFVHVPVGNSDCRFTADAAVPDQSKANGWLFDAVWPYPTCWLPLVPFAVDEKYPLGFKSKTLAAVPVQNSAWLLPPVVVPPPTCCPPPGALANVRVNPLLGCKSTALAAVPCQRIACESEIVVL